MKQVKAALIGAGLRGAQTYAQYAIDNPNELRFIAIAEPNIERRTAFAKTHKIPEEMQFETWEEMLAKPRLCEAILICTQDKIHYLPAKKAIKRGYHTLLEKPMSIDPEECLSLQKLSEKENKILLICHVLRYTPFFKDIKDIIDNNEIGDVVSIQHNENIGYFHYAHSYVRGNWNNMENSSPIILAKSCHDMDILLWLAGEKCSRVSSFGSLSHFNRENAPANCAERCLDGCDYIDTCPYSARKLYLGENTDWPVTAISNDLSFESRLREVKTGPYGRCVYHCDNDVVDHQVVNLEFDSGITVSFNMSAFTSEISRTIKIMGTKGEISGHMEKNEIRISRFSDSKERFQYPKILKGGHGGGDTGLMKSFVKNVDRNLTKDIMTSARISAESHMIAFAAEASRRQNRIIEMKNFVKV